jgi:predicted secreted protein
MAKKTATDPQIEMMVMALTDVVQDMVAAKCGELSGRDKATLKRRIVKVIRGFIAGATPKPK